MKQPSCVFYLDSVLFLLWLLKAFYFRKNASGLGRSWLLGLHIIHLLPWSSSEQWTPDFWQEKPLFCSPCFTGLDLKWSSNKLSYNLFSFNTSSDFFVGTSSRKFISWCGSSHHNLLLPNILFRKCWLHYPGKQMDSSEAIMCPLLCESFQRKQYCNKRQDDT